MGARTVLLAAATLALASCGGETKTVTETVEADSSTEATTDSGPSRRTASSEGISITVRKATASKTLRYIGGTTSSETPDGNAKTIEPPQRGRYVAVATTVKNGTKASLDLTCSLPIKMGLGAGDRIFDPVAGLAQIAGNPECNAALQPGFKSKMTWVFLVPRDSKPDAITFFAVEPTTAGEDPDQVAIALPDGL